MLMLAGDLTRHGTLAEGRVVADEFRDLPLPVVAVLGNHDYHSDLQHEIAGELRDAGVTVLDDDRAVVECGGTKLGVVGGKGFGGGFAGKCASEFGEPEIKDFVRHTRLIADGVAGRAQGGAGRPPGGAVALFAGQGDPGGRAAGDLPVPRQLSAGRGGRHGGRRPDPARPRAQGHARRA